MAKTTGRRIAPAWILLALAVLGLVLHMRVFAFVTDDAFISFVYSRNLARYGELVFNLGERVEGYTNFLWTVFLAGLLKAGWLPESASIFWGVVFAVGSMTVCTVFMRWAREEGPAWSAWDALPALLLAATPGYACWSSGGLETQMFTFWVTLAGLLFLRETERSRRGVLSGLVFGLAALTRPEGNLFFALACAWRLGQLLRGRCWPCRRDLAWLGLFLVLVGPHLVWRHHYYGWWLPNTFYIKSSGGVAAWQRGAYYLGRLFEQHAVWALIVLAAAALWRAGARARRLAGWSLIVSAIFFAYIVSVGGDFMGLFRFALPVAPLLALPAVLGLRAAWRPIEEHVRFSTALVAAVLLGLFVWHVVGVDRAALVPTADRGIDTPGYLRRYTANRAAIGKWFARYAQPDDYAVVGGAGAQVYYSGIRSLDCFGLSDEYIAHRVRASDHRPGHEKYAPLDYQLSKRPTIITSNYYRIGSAPVTPPDDRDWRRRGYHYVNVEVPGLVEDDHGRRAGWYTFLKRMDRTLGPLAPVIGDID